MKERKAKMEEKESLWEKIIGGFTKHRKKIDELTKLNNDYRDRYLERLTQLAKLCNDSRCILEMVKDLHDTKFQINCGQSNSLGSSGSSGLSYDNSLMILENNLQSIKEYLTVILKDDGTTIVGEFSTPDNIIKSVNSVLKNSKLEYSKISNSNLARIKIVDN